VGRVGVHPYPRRVRCGVEFLTRHDRYVPFTRIFHFISEFLYKPDGGKEFTLCIVSTKLFGTYDDPTSCLEKNEYIDQEHSGKSKPYQL
jgi:hypothetical protein